jgi:hypothetical protein
MYYVGLTQHRVFLAARSDLSCLNVMLHVLHFNLSSSKSPYIMEHFWRSHAICADPIFKFDICVYKQFHEFKYVGYKIRESGRVYVFFLVSLRNHVYFVCMHLLIIYYLSCLYHYKSGWHSLYTYLSKGWTTEKSWFGSRQAIHTLHIAFSPTPEPKPLTEMGIVWPFSTVVKG